MNPQEPQQEFHSRVTAPASSGLSGVLVVTQGSRTRHVLERAARLPLAPGAQVVVLRQARPALVPRRGSASAGSADRLETRLEEHARAAGGQLSLVESSAGEDLLAAMARYRERYQPELVLLAREPRSLRSRLFGAFPEKLARHSEVPVLVAELMPKHSYEHVLVGTDFSEASRAALELALRMTTPGTGTVDVLHSYDTGYALTLHMTNASAAQLLEYYQQRLAEAEQAMRAFLAPYQQAPVVLRSLLTREDPRLALHQAACRKDMELLVVGKHRHAPEGLGHALLGSVAESCMRRACYDVLVVPGPTPH